MKASKKLKGNVIKVQVTPEVFHDLDKIQQVQAEVLKRLGCAACCSGHDIRFDIEREFVLGGNLVVKFR